MPKRVAVNVSLTPALAKFVSDRVKKGRYQSASEVVRDGLRVLAEREKERQAAVEEIRRKIAEGIAQADRGEFVDGEAVFAEWRRRDQAARKRRRSA